MTIAALILWGALSIALLFGLIAPGALLAAARVARRFQKQAPANAPLPAITVLVMASRAESWILEYLRRLLNLDYPADLLEVAVVCADDADLTCEIARTVDDARVRVIQTRRGFDLARVLTSAVEVALGDIVVCTECNVDLSRDALRRIAAKFARCGTGMVSGRVGEELCSGQSLGLTPIAALLTVAESDLGLFLPVAVGVSAARRELWHFASAEPALDPMPTAHATRRRRLRVEYIGAPLGERRSIDVESARFGWQAWQKRGGRLLSLVHRAPWLRIPWRRDVVAFWVRHVGLWVCPLFLFVALAANCALSADPRYLRLLLAQESLYIAALVILRRVQARHPIDLREERAVEETLSGGMPTALRGHVA